MRQPGFGCGKMLDDSSCVRKPAVLGFSGFSFLCLQNQLCVQVCQTCHPVRAMPQVLGTASVTRQPASRCLVPVLHLGWCCLASFKSQPGTKSQCPAAALAWGFAPVHGQTAARPPSATCAVPWRKGSHLRGVKQCCSFCGQSLTYSSGCPLIFHLRGWSTLTDLGFFESQVQTESRYKGRRL